MLKDITLGQFFPGKSFLHRLDARCKLMLVIVYIVALPVDYTVHEILQARILEWVAYLFSKRSS